MDSAEQVENEQYSQYGAEAYAGAPAIPPSTVALIPAAATKNE